MIIRTSPKIKLLISLIVFSVSLPFTMHNANESAGHLSLLIVWLISLSMIDRRQFLAQFYYLLFGVFFVVPPAIAREVEFLAVGQFFHSINLSPIDVVKMQFAVFTFLAVFPWSILLIKRSELSTSGTLETEIKNATMFYFVLVLSFIMVMSFNAREALAVYSQGYEIYFSGNLDVQKSMPILLMEYAFVVTAILGVTSRKMFPAVLMLVYAASLIMSGQRMPGAMLVILVAATAFPNSLLRRNFLFVAALGFGVAPPLMMIVQTLRAVGIDGLTGIDLLYFFTDFWAVIGHSLDTLKAAVISGQTSVDGVNLFARLNVTLNVVFSRVLGVDLSLSTNGFGTAFSEYFAPDLFYERRVTFASSGIAESFYVLGYLGVAIYAFAAAWLSIGFQKRMEIMDPLGLLVLFVFAPRFLVGVRNELFGWFFEGAIYFLTMYPIYRLLKFVFIRVRSH